MPGRSPHRRSPPPPPLISRHSPQRGRMRSPDRHHMEMASSGRGRERREYRPSNRRSRSPVQPKGRSYSPPLKRKASSPVREREIPRKTKISKSPIGSRGGSEHRLHGTYVPVPENNSHIVRNVTDTDRFKERGYDEERAVPQFRGPEGSVDFDVNELKKFTVEIIRKPSGVNDESLINRNITNPDEIVPVRRPDSYAEDNYYYDKGRGKGMRGSEGHRGRHYGRQRMASPEWINHEDDNMIPFNLQTTNLTDEGARPLFLRGDPVASTSKDRQFPSEDYRRIVAIDPSRVSGGHDIEQSRERARFVSSSYVESRRPHYPERERSPYEVRLRSPPREEYIDPRDKLHERRVADRDDLRRDLDVKRREERRYTPERRGSYERESDLRTRIIEKRGEPQVRPEEREREHSSRRYDNEREKHSRSHHSSPPRERRRGGSLDRRGEVWERERERDGGRERDSGRERERDGGRERDSGRERDGGSERRRRERSREREDRGRDRYDHNDEKRSHSYKTDYDHKKFYKNYEDKEFIPPPSRGRGIPPIRRGMPPMMRGRGMVPRGMNRGGFRMPMGGMVRGIPRAPFMPMRGFPPPRFFPPY